VPVRLARERQLLHPLRALNREHPSITRLLRDDYRPCHAVLSAKNKCLAESTNPVRGATNRRENGNQLDPA
jgi:hypothetical protein